MSTIDDISKTIFRGADVEKYESTLKSENPSKLFDFYNITLGIAPSETIEHHSTYHWLFQPPMQQRSHRSSSVRRYEWCNPRLLT